MKTFKQFVAEVKKPTGKLKDACWTGYTAVGMKMKGGRKVPNCVPEEVELQEEFKKGDRVRHNDGTLGTVTSGPDEQGIVQWKHAGNKHRASHKDVLKSAADEKFRWRQHKEEVEQVNEMDKSQPSSSRGAEGVPLGKKADPVKTDKVKKDALKTLEKSYKKVKEEVFEKVRQIPGKLIIKEYPTKTVSTETLRNHLKKLEQRDFKVDMVVVDYGDLLKPVTAQREKRNELEGIYEELRGIAAELKCPLWTASQTNRSGLNAEVVTMESISEAFNKCFVADFIFSVSRTVDDKKTNSGRIFIAKNRNGPDGIVMPLYMDTSIVKMEVLEDLKAEELEETKPKKTRKKNVNSDM